MSPPLAPPARPRGDGALQPADQLGERSGEIVEPVFEVTVRLQIERYLVELRFAGQALLAAPD
jgi:hypothetical protein